MTFNRGATGGQRPVPVPTLIQYRKIHPLKLLEGGSAPDNIPPYLRSQSELLIVDISAR